ncbi:MAG: DNA translocase FtsK [Bacteroides sp.]|nr:DNA translocase FtsK [Bacteroides sp.]
MRTESNTIMTDNFDPDALDREYERRRAQQHNTDPDDEPEGIQKKKSAKKNESASKPKRPNRIITFLRDKRTRMFAGITILCWATYLLVASISFFTAGADDQSNAINKTVEEMSQNPGEIHNLGGALGAYLSQNIISDGLGIGVFILILYFFMLGWRLLHKSKVHFWSLTFKSLIDAVTLSMVAGFVAIETGVSSWVYWGGIHGHEVNLYLISVMDHLGAFLVNIVLIALVASIYLRELSLLYLAYRKRVKAHREKVAAERRAKEERQRMIEEQLRESSKIVTGEEETQEHDDPTASEEAAATITPKFIDLNTAFAPADEELHETMPENSAEAIDEEEEELPVNEESAEETVAHEYNQVPYIPIIDDNIDDFQEEETSQEEAPEEIDSPTDEPVENEIIDEDADLEDGTGEMVVNINEIEQARKIQSSTYDPTAGLPKYHFPSIELLDDIAVRSDCVDETEMEENKNRITATLNNYKIAISKIEATVGPTVTLYEIVPAEGIRIAQIKRLEDDIALSLAALGIRIIAPIPGKGTIGIEVPNKEPQMVPIRSIISSKAFQECRYALPMAIGSTISKDVFIADLAKVPHLLVAGATGQGKSVGLNTIIASLLYKKHPSELKFVLIDPKTVEFTLYSKLEKHYLAKLPDEDNPIVCDPMKVVNTLNSVCVEMENRFKLFNKAESRDIKEYNKKFVERRLNPENGHFFMPYIVVIIDEFADLIMVAGKEVERPVARLAQKARAAGIHVILATQRPSTDVITGMIKANFPGRMAFRVMQMVDSRTILDRPGANQLIGKGDMLISIAGEITRVQCAYISTEEVVGICRAVNEQMGYPCAYELPEYEPEGSDNGNVGSTGDRDSLFEEAARFCIASGTASTSSLQRRYSIGYNRAGKIMDQLEAAGVVGPASGAKPRSVLIDSLQLDRLMETF